MENQEENVVTRLKLFMDKIGISSSQFADQCGIPRPSLSQLLNGRNKKISSVLVKQIHERFPELSVMWLMFNEGNMFSPTPLSAALASEGEKFIDDDTEESENLKENELTFTQNSANMLINRGDKSNSAQTAFPSKIDINGGDLRKVKSITVFYDDNSYETFVPSR